MQRGVIDEPPEHLSGTDVIAFPNRMSARDGTPQRRVGRKEHAFSPRAPTDHRPARAVRVSGRQGRS
eukprot:657979-Hanusia_phi.AAC.1